MIEKIDKNDKIHGLSTHTIVDKINEIIDFLNDAHPTKVKECTFDTLSSVYDSHISDACIDNALHSVSIRGNAKCPHCGESYYTELYSESTAIYYPPIYKDGVNINPDMNKTTTHCECLNCHKEFTI